MAYWLMLIRSPNWMANALRVAFQPLERVIPIVPSGRLIVRTVRYKHLSAACSEGNAPRFRVALRSREFNDSIMFVPGMKYRVGPRVVPLVSAAAGSVVWPGHTV